MLNKFKTHIDIKFSELKANKFLIACSGGVDSVVLVHLCHALGLDFAIAHCNFQLRGIDSNTDEFFVEKLANKINKKIYITHFNTNNYVVLNKVSVQMAARELRYTWFAELLRENRMYQVVTAHHADDDLETFLINLSRGTGIDGLTGIPSKNAFISRPLLPFSRADILAYAKAENISWREDSSNKENKYLRNKIRHDIVPLLKELHPTFEENFKTTQSHLISTSIIFENHIKDLKLKLFKNREGLTRISISEIEKLYPQKTYLFSLFKAYGFGKVCDDVSALLKGMSGKEVRSKTYRLVKDREHLLLEKLQDKVFQTYKITEGQKKIDFPISLSIEEVEAIKDTSENILYVDKAVLKFPLSVRKWQKGDYFYPFGMVGKKKLSKFFKDEKIDIISKEKQWLLCSGEDIVWVIGKRADNRYRVTEQTKRSVKFIVNK